MVVVAGFCAFGVNSVTVFSNFSGGSLISVTLDFSSAGDADSVGDGDPVGDGDSVAWLSAGSGPITGTAGHREGIAVQRTR